jgi:aspartyl-tRNA(Asn)/glutamyl-tRNA(Gln) amidotransferase subunit B
MASGDPVGTIIETRGLRQISDRGALDEIVARVLAENAKAVADYRAGKPTIGFLVGQVMKATGGQANAGLVQAAIRERLEAGAPDARGS